MRLNKHKREYIEPDQPKPCRIVDGHGGTFHPTTAPEGLCRCGVVLQFNPKKADYIFPSMARALHAKEHTIKYLKLLGLPFDSDSYIVEVVK